MAGGLHDDECASLSLPPMAVTQSLWPGGKKSAITNGDAFHRIIQPNCM